MNENTQAATPIAADEPTHLSQDKAILETPIKIDEKATPYVLIDFAKIRKDCSNRNEDLCLSDPENPQDCEVGLCPILKMPIKRRAEFLELMENGR